MIHIISRLKDEECEQFSKYTISGKYFFILLKKTCFKEEKSLMIY